MKKNNIYTLGVATLSFAYYPLKENFSVWSFVGICICYLFLISVVADKIGK